MSATTTNATDIIKGALLNANIYAPADILQPSDLDVCQNSLNDLLDSLSTDEAFIYTQSENIFAWTSGQYQYTIGNPTASNTFSAVTTSGSATITVTNPSTIQVTFGLNALGVKTGGTLTDTASAIPSGTTIVSLSGSSLTMSQPATASVSTIVSYTVPGNFAISRPLRIRNSFTRVTTSAAAGLDYFIDVISFDRYNEIGLKTVPGPWPYVMAYQPTYPYANLWVYPNPSITGQVFLYTDLILTQFTSLTQPINLPQGYARALKKLLALEIAPIYGKVPSPMLILQAKEAKTLLMAQNASPVTTLRYDSDLIYSRHTDASWIVSGGFV